MNTIGAIVTFSVTWWLLLFMVLPFGVKAQENPEPGTDPGAPQKPRIVLKMLITTVLAGLVTYGIAWFIESGLIEIRPQTG